MDTQFVAHAFQEAQLVLERFAKDPEKLAAVAKGAELIAGCIRDGGRVISCGNGGSMCDAMHFAEELSGKFRQERAPLPATAISDPAHITCVGNDFGFDQIFSKYVAAHGRRGDVLLGISTSGKSPNILKAIEAAKACGMGVVTLTGRQDSPVGARANVDICAVGNEFSDRTQEMHIKIIHILIEAVERTMFPANYKVSAAR